MREMEKPCEVICNDQYTGSKKGWGREWYKWPSVREILEVDKMTDDGEDSLEKWERVREV